MTKKQIALGVLLLLVSARFGFSSDDKATGAEELLSRARQVEVWSDGSPAVTIHAELSVADPKNGTAYGSYSLVWESMSHWEDQIHFANYERMRVRDGQTLWQKSSLNYRPLVIFQLDKLLNLKDELTVLPKQKLKKPSGHKEHGIDETCVAVQTESGTDRTLCFDSKSGAAVGVEYPTGESRHAPAITKIEYGSFTTVDGKLIPNEVQAFRDREMVAEVKVTDVLKTKGDDLAELKPPADAEAWPTCDDMVPAELTTRVSPRYPAGAREQRREGKVTFYAVIEPDGTLSGLQPIQGTDASLLAATAQALRQWRYKPATCGQKPVRIETSVSADFWLQY